MSKDGFIAIYEDWEKVGDTVFYKWRTDGEDEWHYRKTPYKDKPVVHFRYLTQEEWEYFKQDSDEIKDWEDIPPEAKNKRSAK